MEVSVEKVENGVIVRSDTKTYAVEVESVYWDSSARKVGEVVLKALGAEGMTQ